MTDWSQPRRLHLHDRIHWQGADWEVAAFPGMDLTLWPLTGDRQPVTAQFDLVTQAPDFAVLNAQGRPAGTGRLPPLGVFLWRATSEQRKEALRWHRHMKELDTGLRPGRRIPRPGYDPETTTLEQRYAVKSAELAAADIHISPRGLEERRLKWKKADEDPMVLLPKPAPGPGPEGGTGRTDPRLIAVMRVVTHRQAGGESGGTMSRVYDDVLALVEERYAEELKDPAERRRLLLARSTFYERMNKTGLADVLRGTARSRRRKANKPQHPYTPESALRPGELVQIDTAPLKIKALGDDGQVISAELTAAIDVATRSCMALMIVPAHTGEGPVGARIGGRATKTFDLVLLLAQCYAVLPTRPGWSRRTAAAHSALPFEELRAADPRFDEAAMARPVIHPETIVVDQGSPYLSEHFERVCKRLGISLLYARKETPTDKPIVEAFFRSFGDTFSQWVPGWTGRDHDQRGRIDRARLLTINELQAAAEEWLALDYQQMPHHGLRSPRTPGVVLSPNEMYAHAVALSGYRPIQLMPEDNRWLLVPAWTTITDKGVQIANRTYQNYKGQLYELKDSTSGLSKSGKWLATYDPYHPDVAWLRDHRGKGHWIPVEFIHRNLMTNRWTQYMWADTEAQLAVDGKPTHDQAAVALEVQARRRRIRSGPAPRRHRQVPFQPVQPFQGVLRLETETDAPNPYAGLVFDPDTIEAFPSLHVSDRPSSAALPSPTHTADDVPTPEPPQAHVPASAHDTDGADDTGI